MGCHRGGPDWASLHCTNLLRQRVPRRKLTLRDRHLALRGRFSFCTQQRCSQLCLCLSMYGLCGSQRRLFLNGGCGLCPLQLQPQPDLDLRVIEQT